MRRAAALAALLAFAGAARADVTVEQGKKGLVITGDSDSDVVDVQGQGAMGNVEVWVNGVFVDSFVGVGDIKAKLGGGDDTLSVAGIFIGGLLKVEMGEGSDSFTLDTSPDVGAAPDHDVFIGAGLDVAMGGQPDDFIVCVTNSLFTITIGGDVILAGSTGVGLDGGGGSTLADPSDIHVGGKLKISKTMGVVDLDDVNVGLITIIQLGGSQDSVEMTDCRFAGSVSVSLGGGDDRIDLPFPNDFNGPVTFQGGQDSDIFDGNPANVFTFPPSLTGFEIVN